MIEKPNQDTYNQLTNLMWKERLSQLLLVLANAKVKIDSETKICFG